MAVVALCCLSTGAFGQDIAAGQDTFLHYCATCHGAEALGNGPMSPVLLVQPKNLTLLAAENDGVFPVGRVIWRIDGRDPLASHGSSMPVYGDFFEGRGTAIRGEDGILIMSSKPIVDLIAWLQSIQKEAGN
jgi:hypothetical protein